MPTLVRPLHVKLDERAGQLLILPGRGRLAGTKANDCVIHPHGLARLQCQVPDDSVPFVEETQHGDTVRHRGHASLLTRTGACRWKPCAICLLRFIATPASCQEQRQSDNGETSHPQSGVQG
jgi:hypothetical protein